ncbi:hypothetical protein ACFWMJ_03225 [Streptomyces hawaiiensis]|uniref:hypothetical protein n=1 Tax=Streptomyces hawaiiensis TaxID=67305 RepID=UPI0036512CED
MPTEHACRSAAELAAQHLDSLRPFLQPGHPHGGGPGGIGDWPLGASALLVVLAGLQADQPGELTLWHAHAGDRIREALGLPGVGGLPGAGTEGLRPGRPPQGWEALALVQQKAQELLTDLADGSRLGRPGELSRQLALVEDAFTGALRRMAVPQEASARCAAALAEAAGSLFGLRPSAPLPLFRPPHHTPAPPHHTPAPPHHTPPPPHHTPPPPQPTAKPPLPPDLTASILF